MTHRSFDGLGPVGVSEGVVGVLEGRAGAGHRGHHHAAAIATQGVLEQARQLAVAVRNEGLAVCQGVDAVAYKH